MRREYILLAIVGALVAFYYRKPIAMTVGKITRGIRNNNPGNIERNTTKWNGMAPDQSGDARFIVFTAPEWGIRAIARILLTKYSKGMGTVHALINSWAPPTENDTSAYVNAVAKALNVPPDAQINVPARLNDLVRAIIKHENGYHPYSLETIADGVRRALN